MGSETSNTAVLLISCPDRRGIVAALAQLLYGYGANILDSDQHSDLDSGQFFQRVRVDLSDIHTDRGALERAIAEVAERFQMTWRISYANTLKRLAVFVSKYDHCLYDLLLRHRAGEIRAEIPLIISNHPDLAPVARHFGAELVHIPVTSQNKGDAERQAITLLQEHRIDLVVLARYMQILSPEFVDRYPGRIINIHHSFLPAFVGGKPYHQAHARGVKLIGATAHYATSVLDEGPIIEQDVIRTSHRDTVEDLVRKGRDLERAVLARAVRWHVDDRVVVFSNKTVVLD